MGGHGHFHPVKNDAQIDRWINMRENVYQTFKFTRKVTNHVIALCVAVPLTIYLAENHFGKRYDWLGKRRDQSLLLRPPPAQPKPEADAE